MAKQQWYNYTNIRANKLKELDTTVPVKLIIGLSGLTVILLITDFFNLW